MGSISNARSVTHDNLIGLTRLSLQLRAASAVSGPGRLVAQYAFLLLCVRLFLSSTLIPCAHPAGRLAGSVEPKLFGGFLLLARKKALDKTEASFPIAVSPSLQERFADLSHTATLRGSDLLQMPLKI